MIGRLSWFVFLTACGFFVWFVSIREVQRGVSHTSPQKVKVSSTKPHPLPDISNPPLLSELTKIALWTREATLADIVSPTALRMWQDFSSEECIQEILAEWLAARSVTEFVRVIRLVVPQERSAKFLERLAFGWPEKAWEFCQALEVQRHPAFRMFATGTIRSLSRKYPESAAKLASALPAHLRGEALSVVAGALASSHPDLASEAFEAWLSACGSGPISTADNQFCQAFAPKILEAARTRRLPKYPVLTALHYRGKTDPMGACKWAATAMTAYDEDSLSTLQSAIYDSKDAGAAARLLEGEVGEMREPLKSRVMAAAVGTLARHAPGDAAARIATMSDTPLKEFITKEFTTQAFAAPASVLASFLNNASGTPPELIEAVLAEAGKNPYKAVELFPLISNDQITRIRQSIEARWGADGVAWLETHNQLQ